MKLKSLSIVIPVFNEEQYIEQTLQKVVKASCFRLKKEIIVVDDGSTDQSRTKILSFIRSKKHHKNIRFRSILFDANKGKGAALKAGFLNSTGDVVIVQDADLEYDPWDYLLLLEPFISYNADVVYGSRFISTRPHRVLYFWHSIVNINLTRFSNMLTNFNLTDMETGCKAFRGQVIRKLAPQLRSKRFGFEPEITARISKIKNIRLYEIGVSYSGRTYEEGKKIGWKDGLRAIWEILYFNVFTR